MALRIRQPVCGRIPAAPFVRPAAPPRDALSRPGSKQHGGEAHGRTGRCHVIPVRHSGRTNRRALEYRDGELTRTLAPGRHLRRRRTSSSGWIWWESLHSVMPQDILTSDGVGVRVSAAVRWQVDDPVVSVERTHRPLDHVHLAAQVALRIRWPPSPRTRSAGVAAVCWAAKHHWCSRSRRSPGGRGQCSICGAARRDPRRRSCGRRPWSWRPPGSVGWPSWRPPGRRPPRCGRWQTERGCSTPTRHWRSCGSSSPLRPARRSWCGWARAGTSLTRPDDEPHVSHVAGSTSGTRSPPGHQQQRRQRGPRSVGPGGGVTCTTPDRSPPAGLGNSARRASSRWAHSGREHPPDTLANLTRGAHTSDGSRRRWDFPTTAIHPQAQPHPPHPPPPTPQPPRKPRDTFGSSVSTSSHSPTRNRCTTQSRSSPGESNPDTDSPADQPHTPATRAPPR